MWPKRYLSFGGAGKVNYIYHTSKYIHQRNTTINLICFKNDWEWRNQPNFCRNAKVMKCKRALTGSSSSDFFNLSVNECICDAYEWLRFAAWNPEFQTCGRRSGFCINPVDGFGRGQPIGLRGRLKMLFVGRDVSSVFFLNRPIISTTY